MGSGAVAAQQPLSPSFSRRGGEGFAVSAALQEVLPFPPQFVIPARGNPGRLKTGFRLHEGDEVTALPVQVGIHAIPLHMGSPTRAQRGNDE